jgi:hypothetical protein
MAERGTDASIVEAIGLQILVVRLRRPGTGKSLTGPFCISAHGKPLGAKPFSSGKIMEEGRLTEFPSTHVNNF